jgi:hypothetical protein
MSILTPRKLRKISKIGKVEGERGVEKMHKKRRVESGEWRERKAEGERRKGSMAMKGFFAEAFKQ